MISEKVLMIVDAQVNMFIGESAVFESERILVKLKKLIHLAREKSIPIIFIQHNGPVGDVDEHGTEGWKIHPEILPLDSEVVFQKYQVDAFIDTKLNEYLQATGVKELIVAGMQSDHCIQTNCLHAAKLGYQVLLVKDAHSTMDSKSDKAADIINKVNQLLQSRINLLEFSENILTLA